jgi:hypothetical protein
MLSFLNYWMIEEENPRLSRKIRNIIVTLCFFDAVCNTAEGPPGGNLRATGEEAVRPFGLNFVSPPEE